LPRAMRDSMSFPKSASMSSAVEPPDEKAGEPKVMLAGRAPAIAPEDASMKETSAAAMHAAVKSIEMVSSASGSPDLTSSESSAHETAILRRPNGVASLEKVGLENG